MNKTYILRKLLLHKKEGKKEIEVEIGDVLRVSGFVVVDKLNKIEEVEEYIKSIPHQRVNNKYVIEVSTLEKMRTKEYVDKVHEVMFYAEKDILKKRISEAVYKEYVKMLGYIEKQLMNVPNTLDRVCKVVSDNLQDMKENYDDVLKMRELESRILLLNVIKEEKGRRVDKKEIIREIRKRTKRYESEYRAARTTHSKHDI